MLKLIISLDPATNRLTVDGPIDNWPLCYELLDSAKEQIKVYHSQKIARGGIVAAPASALPPANGSAQR